jgi:class 3 adenylate cyclase
VRITGENVTVLPFRLLQGAEYTHFMADAIKRKLAAILAADAVGYSRLMQGDEAVALGSEAAPRDHFRPSRRHPQRPHREADRRPYR